MAGSRPTITSHRAASLSQATPERFWIPLDFRCRRWRPANFRGHSVSSALPCISFHNRAEGTAGTFQRGKFPNLHLIRKRVLESSTASPLPTRQQNLQHTASLDELAEPNYYSKYLQTSSTRVFASHCRIDGRTAGRGLARCLDRAPLADSASSLYTTSFPIHSTARPA